MAGADLRLRRRLLRRLLLLLRRRCTIVGGRRDGRTRVAPVQDRLRIEGGRCGSSSGCGRCSGGRMMMVAMVMAMVVTMVRMMVMVMVLLRMVMRRRLLVRMMAVMVGRTARLVQTGGRRERPEAGEGRCDHGTSCTKNDRSVSAIWMCCKKLEAYKTSS